MQENLRAAIEAMREPTKGTYRFDWLMGPHMAEARAAMLTLLTGKKVVKSKARWGDVRREFYAATAIDGRCEADRESRFCDFCRAAMGQPSFAEEFEAKHPPTEFEIRQAQRVLDEIPGCSAAGMAKQIGCTETRGAKLLELARA